MSTLWKTQQAAERVRYRYLYTNNGQKLLTPVGELQKKMEEVEEEGHPVGEYVMIFKSKIEV